MDKLIPVFELFNSVFCAYPVIPGVSPENQDNYKPQQLKAFVCSFKNHYVDHDTLQQKPAQPLDWPPLVLCPCTIMEDDWGQLPSHDDGLGYVKIIRQ